MTPTQADKDAAREYAAKYTYGRDMRREAFLAGIEWARANSPPQPEMCDCHSPACSICADRPE